MIRIEIAITAPDVETLRRAMDEIHDAYTRVETEGRDLKRVAIASDTKLSKLGDRKLAVAKILDDVADAIDTATPRKVI